jgi:Ca-activated chloride channel family protein
MLQFAHPLILLLALPIPLLVWWWLRQRRTALRFPATGFLTGLPSGRSPWARRGGAILRGLALLLLVVALAGPRWPDLRTRLPAEGIAVMMVTDISGSMAEPDFDWRGQPMTRLDAVKKAFGFFVEGGDADGGVHFDGRPDDLIGLVAFATRPDCPCPLTLSHSVLLKILRAEQPRSIPGESETNISDALVLGLYRLRSAQTKRKILILLSDGEHNVPHPQSDWTPRQAAQIAANLHVPVYAIDAGGSGTSMQEREPDGTTDPALLRAEGKRTLQEVARITHGRYFQASDTASLLRVCQEIDRLEKTEIQSFQYRRYYEAFPWLGLGSLLLWLTVSGLEMTFWRRLP